MRALPGEYLLRASRRGEYLGVPGLPEYHAVAPREHVARGLPRDLQHGGDGPGGQLLGVRARAVQKHNGERSVRGMPRELAPDGATGCLSMQRRVLSRDGGAGVCRARVRAMPRGDVWDGRSAGRGVHAVRSRHVFRGACGDAAVDDDDAFAADIACDGRRVLETAEIAAASNTALIAHVDALLRERDAQLTS